MKDRFLKLVAVLGAAALVTGLVVVNANAHIGASHSPFTTEGPDLREVLLNADDDVLFCFDEEVSSFTAGGNELDFQLAGFDSATRTTASDAELATTDDVGDLGVEADNCIFAEFDDTNRDLDLFTVGLVNADTVEDRDGNDNVEASAALDDGDDSTDPDDDSDGDTEAPNLESFEVEDEEDNLLLYIYDEDVDCDAYDDDDQGGQEAGAEEFVAYDEEGWDSRQFGEDVVGCDDNEITVEFGGDIDDTQRVANDPNPNQGGDVGGGVDEFTDVCTPDDTAGTGDPCTGHEHAGEDTDDPDLTGVERTDDEEWTYTFDEDIEAVSAVNFYLYERDGTKYEADDCDEENDDQVQCDFEGLEDQAEDIVLGAVDECAVTDDDATAECNTIGDQPVEDTIDPDDDDEDTGAGSTDAPDLESCDIDLTESLVTFNFDEAVDDDNDPAESDLDVFDEDGNLASADEVDDVEGSTVIAEFDEDALSDAVGCHIDQGAVTDELGNASLEAAVGSEEGGGASTTTATTGSTATTTVTGGTTDPGPRTIRVDSTITIRYDRKPARKAAVKGAVAARFDRCTQGRGVELHKRGKGVIGRDTTNSRGNYKIPKRIRRGRIFTQVLRKTFTQRDGDTVICRPDESVTINVGGRRRR